MSNITIIGLGLVGTSLGLALKQHDPSYTIMGHDKERSAVAQAKKRGAIDTSNWNLINACSDANVILLAIPLSGIAPTLKAIRDDLKPGCLIIDTASSKGPVLEAAKVLPDHVHFVGSNPILVTMGRTSAEHARADLFKDVPWALCPTPTASDDAVRVTTNMITALGAQPLFLDATEHDGLMVAVETLPTILAAATTNIAKNNHAWREIRHVAGEQFERATRLPSPDAAGFAAAAMTNADTVDYWLDTMIAELNAWKQNLRSGEEEEVVQRFAEAIDSRAQWLGIRHQKDWEEWDEPADAPAFWKGMFGMGRRSKKRT